MLRYAPGPFAAGFVPESQSGCPSGWRIWREQIHLQPIESLPRAQGHSGPTGQGGVRISQPNSTVYPLTDTARWSSVCRGATLWGLEHPNESITSISLLSNPSTFTANEPTVTSRISRYSYGLSFSVPYNERRHLIHDAYKDEKTGLTMAKQQMTWLLKRVRFYVAPIA